ncbi:hypothetical protein D1AOALGA4SA_201 [Olavius algarvensis Delta 1 endosymbiont]|nr:hypothetical protein D1AOALGA4SA_201 [Olavius algarvensis Delta 1 endosymbiont]
MDWRYRFALSIIKKTIQHQSSRQAEYLKSKIPPGRRPQWPLQAGGRNPKSKISLWLIICPRFI